ncbi:MAG: carbon-nitrogen hydrolase family protein [Desulfobacterales bacterium]|nr:carbon-nitrogen hydrolase family protein [Desulfobacterales bacterium]
MMEWSKMRVALVQVPPRFLNLEESLNLAETLVEKAVEEGAELVVFPETWLPGYPVWLDNSPGAALWDSPGARSLYGILHGNSLELGSPALGRMIKWCKTHQIYLVMGCHERVGKTLYNSQLFLSPRAGEWFCRRKIMPTYNEKLIWGQGDGRGLRVLDSPAGPLGGLICWEHWMPLARAAMHGLQEVIHVAQWPSVNELHQLASRHYAFEGSCFVLASGTVLSRGDVLEGFDSLGLVDGGGARAMLEATAPRDRDLLMTGGSCVIGPDAGFIQEPVFNESRLIYADIDPAQMVETGMLMDSQGHYSRPDIFSLQVNRRPMEGVRFSMEDLA